MLNEVKHPACEWEVGAVLVSQASFGGQILRFAQDDKRDSSPQTEGVCKGWIPACAGMTTGLRHERDSDGIKQ